MKHIVRYILGWLWVPLVILTAIVLALIGQIHPMLSESFTTRKAQRNNNGEITHMSLN
jgi:hypothetical protein